MNRRYISDELNKRGIPHRYYWCDAGLALQFTVPGTGALWNSLPPIDDESDAKFVDFVASAYMKYKAAADAVSKEEATNGT